MLIAVNENDTLSDDCHEIFCIDAVLARSKLFLPSGGGQSVRRL